MCSFSFLGQYRGYAYFLDEVLICFEGFIISYLLNVCNFHDSFSETFFLVPFLPSWFASQVHYCSHQIGSVNTLCNAKNFLSVFIFLYPWWLATQVHNCTHQISVVNWTPSVKHNFFLLLCLGTSCSSWISAIGSSHKPYVLLLWRWFHVSEIRILQ